jgi:hypothetical protein
MGSRKHTTTATKKEVIRKSKAHLDELPTRDAQVLRMRHGIAEPPSAAVGRPARGTSAELRKRLESIELDILARAAEAEETDDTKSKILRALKKKT